MVGNWLCESEVNSGGVKKWLARRHADGTYELTFLSRANGMDEVTKEAGLWGISGPIYFTITMGLAEGGEIQPITVASSYFNDAYQIIRLDQEYFEYESFSPKDRFVVRRVSDYVNRLESWVNQFVAAGVEPEKITLVGFSRSGQFTALATSRLNSMRINTALLAICWPTGVQEQESITLSGRFLSMYETTDSALSCHELADGSPELSSFEEVDITTGKERGAFYTPLSD
jgi:hypothetical protein